MSVVVLTFTSREWMPKVGDYCRLELEYALVDRQFLGTTQEQTRTTYHAMPIVITRGIMKEMEEEATGQPEWEKLVLECARREIESRLAEGGSLEQELRIDPYSPAYVRSLDPSAIQLALHVPILLTIDRPLGFRPV